jgi:hypothetical protein
MTTWTVKLVRCKSLTASPQGGGLKWTENQSRPFKEDDPRLPYYQRHRAFDASEKKEPKHVVPPSARPKKAKEKVKPAAPPPEPDQGAEDALPLAEPAPELDESPPGADIPSDDELEKWRKDDLLDLAAEHGLDHVSGSMTKAEIRAEIDTIR